MFSISNGTRPHFYYESRSSPSELAAALHDSHPLQLVPHSYDTWIPSDYVPKRQLYCDALSTLRGTITTPSKAIQKVIVVTDSVEKIARSTVAKLQRDSDTPVYKFACTSDCSCPGKGIVVMTTSQLLHWSLDLEDDIAVGVLYVDTQSPVFFARSIVVHNFVCPCSAPKHGMAACGILDPRNARYVHVRHVRRVRDAPKVLHTTMKKFLMVEPSRSGPHHQPGDGIKTLYVSALHEFLRHRASNGRVVVLVYVCKRPRTNPDHIRGKARVPRALESLELAAAGSSMRVYIATPHGVRCFNDTVGHPAILLGEAKRLKNERTLLVGVTAAVSVYVSELTRRCDFKKELKCKYFHYKCCPAQ